MGMIRRVRRRKRPFILIVLLSLITFMMVVGFAYSYLSLVLKIGGNVSGTMDEQDYILMSGSDPNVSIVVSRINTWQEGNLYKYQYSLHVTNVGQATIDNFKLTIQFLNNIDSVSILNYTYGINGKVLIITNNNYTLANQQLVTIDFIISSRSSTQLIRAIKLEVITNSNEVTIDEFNVVFNITNGWGQYTYQYDVIVTNKTGAKISSWQVNVILPEGTTYVNGWNAIYSFSGNILIIKNEKYNGKLDNNASATLGLQLSTNIINFIPNNIRITVR